MCAMTDWSFFLFATFSLLQCRPLLSRLALAARSERHAAEQVTFLLEGGEKNSLPQITHVFLFFSMLLHHYSPSISESRFLMLSYSPNVG